MATEIERKFLVVSDGWRDRVQGKNRLRQGYLSRESRASVRVRVFDGARATLTIKAAKSRFSRHEFEYPIPLKDASDMLDGFCDRPILEKRRTRIPVGDVVARRQRDPQFGEFRKDCRRRHDTDDDVRDWAGREITEDRRYNAALARLPFTRWT
jgi:adenylate cyclase